MLEPAVFFKTADSVFAGNLTRRVGFFREVSNFRRFIDDPQKQLALLDGAMVLMRAISESTERIKLAENLDRHNSG
jgi:hypothetical protein